MLGAITMTDILDYKQLSDDWRHRDQLTWQLPSVLVAISGTLITIVFEFDRLAHLQVYFLWGGLLFAGLLSITLGQNLYFQAVTKDLMDAIKNGEQVRGDRIPKRRANGPGFGAFMIRGFLKTGSTGLFLLSVGLTGFLGFLISDLQFQSETKFSWRVGTGIIVLVLTVLINLIIYACHKQGLNQPKEERDNQ